MSPIDSHRYIREACWEMRWIPDCETAALVARCNRGTLSKHIPDIEVILDPSADNGKINGDSNFKPPGERPGTRIVSEECILKPVVAEDEWIFVCESNLAVDLLHPGEILFLQKALGSALKSPERLGLKKRMVWNWESTASLAANFIDSTWRVDGRGTSIAERPSIRAPWSAPLPAVDFLVREFREKQEYWHRMMREAEKDMA